MSRMRCRLASGRTLQTAPGMSSPRRSVCAQAPGLAKCTCVGDRPKRADAGGVELAADGQGNVGRDGMTTLRIGCEWHRSCGVLVSFSAQRDCVAENGQRALWLCGAREGSGPQSRFLSQVALRRSTTRQSSAVRRETLFLCTSEASRIEGSTCAWSAHPSWPFICIAAGAGFRRPEPCEPRGPALGYDASSSKILPLCFEFWLRGGHFLYRISQP